MAVDRGGLRYTIEAQDRFSRTTKRFRDEIRKDREEFAKFRAELRKGVSDFRAVRREQSRRPSGRDPMQDEARRRRRDRDQEQRQTAAQARREQQLLREQARTRQSIARAEEAETNRRQRALQAEQRTRAAISRRRAAEAREVAAAERRADAARTRAAREAERATRRAAQQQRNLRRQLKNTQSAANRISFTFRRLFGILAAFQAARAGIDLFRQSLGSAIAFNRQVEDSRISIAGLITATGRVADAQGRALTGAEKFAAAQSIAADQVERLRQDSLRTIATFGELQRAFQAGVGPGLEAGLNLDEIRQVTIGVSQAAAALQVPQNQLIEEVRSLIRGTIQARTTIVASVLGISNEDIRLAREAGNLAEFLADRLEAFGLAAAETQNTFTGLLARVRDLALVVAGTAGAGFFDSIKNALRDVFDLLGETTRRADGLIESITPRPEVVSALQKFFEPLSMIVDQLRAGINLGTLDAVAGSLGRVFAALASVDLGETLQVVLALAEAIAGAIVGFVRGIQSLQNALAPFAQLLGGAAELVALFVQLRTILFAIRFLSREISVLWSGIALRAGGAARSAEAMALAQERAAAASRVLSASLVGAALAGGALVSNLLDVDFSEGINLFIDSFINALDRAVTEARKAAVRVKAAFVSENLGEAILGTIRTTAQSAGAIRPQAGFASRVLGALGFSETAGQLEQQARKQQQQAEEFNKTLDERLGISKEIAELDKAQAERDKEFEGRVGAEGARAEAAAKRKAEDKAREARLEKLRKKVEELNEAANNFQVGGRAPGRAPTFDEAIGLAQGRAQTVFEEERINTLIRINELRRQGASQGAIEIAQERRKIAELQAQQRIQGDIFRARIAEQARIAQIARTAAEGDPTNSGAIQRAVVEQEKYNTLVREAQNSWVSINAQVEAVRAQLQRIQLEEDGTFFQGLEVGLADFVDQFKSQFRAGVEIIQGLVQGLSNFIATSIVAAFDPTNDTSLQERFGQFLQQIATQVLQTLTQLLIATAIARAAGVPLPAGNVPLGGLGFAEGGEIPNGPSHGVIRPAGLDSRDTMPIWAQPGEFMVKKSSADRYGSDVLQAINQGLVNPSLLRSLVGGTGRAVRRAVSRGPGYVDGGTVAGRASTVRTRSRRERSRDNIPIAGILPSEQAAERLNAGGRRANITFTRENRTAQRRALGI